MKEIDRLLAGLAATQHQVISRSQARALGLSASGLSRRVAAGALVACSPGALHFAGVSLTYRGRLQAGLLDLGRDALVSGPAAGHLLGLDGFGEGPLEHLVPRSARHHPTVGTVRSTDSIGALDRVNVDGLACTSATRTVIELLRGDDLDLAADALHCATRMRLTAPAVVERRLRELGRSGRRGVAAFDRLARAGAVESRLEWRFLRVVAEAGLPTPVLQQRYELDGFGVARVDFEFPTFPVVVEVGGRRGYLSTTERQRQERRRTALQLAGKTVYFFTTEDVRDAPEYVTRTLRQALRRAAC